MSDWEMREVLQAYANQPAPAGLLATIRREAERRRARRRWRRGGLAALILTYAFLTFVPGGGSAVAAARQQIQPTLFLKTTLAEAQRVARSPLVLPESFPSYGGEPVPLGPETPALVARWLSYETVAVSLTDGPEGAGVMYFDLRRSTQVAEELAAAERAHPDRVAEPVKVGEHDGLVILVEGQPVTLYWQTENHSYRLFAAGANTVAELVHIAEQIR